MTSGERPLAQHRPTASRAAGKNETLIAARCGPGLAARGPSSHFVNIIGSDPTSSIIETACPTPGCSSSRARMRLYEDSTAQDLGTNLLQLPDQASASSPPQMLRTGSTCPDLDRLWWELASSTAS
ncbi:hypothetical protein MHUMG1_06353 [Metarhizium humberi]|uniref:Uncharacterized protein n=1 Tax=Metarhizium humberi TaxID=2596975 RepID=A0A9P8M8N6_9HYPO|nr:hypothetical protein MHUMG1_06353 [Metarhizium humberi]